MKSRQSAFALQKADHLADIRKTGAGDPELTALARETLDPEETAAFDVETGDAEAHNAARTQYAFMTPKEIAADIKQKAPGGDLSDTDERARGDKARKAAREPHKPSLSSSDFSLPKFLPPPQHSLSFC